MKYFLTAVLLLFATQAFAIDRVKFWKYSSADMTVCSVMGGERVVTDAFIPKLTSARNITMATKVAGGVFGRYSVALTDSQIQISCYNARTFAPIGALYLFDNNTTIFFPVTEKFIQIK